MLYRVREKTRSELSIQIKKILSCFFCLSKKFISLSPFLRRVICVVLVPVLPLACPSDNCLLHFYLSSDYFECPRQVDKCLFRTLIEVFFYLSCYLVCFDHISIVNTDWTLFLPILLPCLFWPYINCNKTANLTF